MHEHGAPELSRLLAAIVAKARTHAWVDWTDDDTVAIEVALRQIAEFPRALREGMQTAFQIGREHGRKEEELEKLEVEIATEVARLAREAWGRRSPA